MMYKKHLIGITILLSLFAAYQIDAKSCEKSCDTKKSCNTSSSCKTKCCVTPSTAGLACIPQFVDYIVVGAGTAGSVLARHLSDQVDGVYANSVVVLELGDNTMLDPLVLQTIDPQNPLLTFGSKYAIAFPFIPGLQAQFNYKGVACSDGMGIGGSSTNNSADFARGTPVPYNEWAALLGMSGADWAYDNLLFYMKQFETYISNGGGFDPAQRGANGPVILNQNDQNVVALNSFNANILSQLPNTPLPILGDYNIPAGSIGIFAHQEFNTTGKFTPGSKRSHSGQAYLPTPEVVAAYGLGQEAVISEDGFGLNGRRLRVVLNAKVCRVLFDGTTAIGLEYILNDNENEVFTIYANKETILCAGNTHTPAILQRSGVGPQTLLESLGIPIVLANDNVGKNFKNHYGSSAIMTVGGRGSQAQFASAKFFTDGAPYFNNGQASDLQRRVQVYYRAGSSLFQDLTAAITAVGPQVLDPIEYPTNSFFIINVTPQNEGSIEIVSKSCLTNPNINAHFWEDYNPLVDPASDFYGSDYDRTIAAFKIIRDAAHMAGETMIYPTEAMFAAADMGDNSQLILACNYLTTMAYDSGCSCPMSQTAATGVVSSRLRVHGLGKLRIVDNSIMPIIIDGNTSAPAFYIGSLAATFICQAI